MWHCKENGKKNKNFHKYECYTHIYITIQLLDYPWCAEINDETIERIEETKPIPLVFSHIRNVGNILIVVDVIMSNQMQLSNIYINRITLKLTPLAWWVCATSDRFYCSLLLESAPIFTAFRCIFMLTAKQWNYKQMTNLNYDLNVNFSIIKIIDFWYNDLSCVCTQINNQQDLDSCFILPRKESRIERSQALYSLHHEKHHQHRPTTQVASISK